MSLICAVKNPAGITNYGIDWTNAGAPRVVLATASPKMRLVLSDVLNGGTLKQMAVGTLFPTISGEQPTQLPSFSHVPCLVYAVGEDSPEDDGLRKWVSTVSENKGTRVVLVSTNHGFLTGQKFEGIVEAVFKTLLLSHATGELDGLLLPFSAIPAKNMGEHALANLIFQVAQMQPR